MDFASSIVVVNWKSDGGFTLDRASRAQLAVDGLCATRQRPTLPTAGICFAQLKFPRKKPNRFFLPRHRRHRPSTEPPSTACFLASHRAPRRRQTDKMAQESRNPRDRNPRRPSRDYNNDRDRRDNRDRRDQRDYPPPPPRQDSYRAANPSLPPRPPPQANANGDGYRRPYGGNGNDNYSQAQDSRYSDFRDRRDFRPERPSSDHYRPPQSDFTFRAEKPSGVQDFPANEYRGNSNQRSNDRRDHGPSRRGARGSRGRGDTFRGRGGRPPRRVFIPSERELLSGNHAAEPELDLSKDGVKYRALEDLSDSDEADMDISGDEGDGSGQEPSRKRTRTSLSTAAGNSVPKWSNPDPYTAIPPESATQTKKKDVVAMIRKARVTTKEEASASIPTEAADFISCDFDSTEAEESEPEVEQEVVSAPSSRGGGRAAVDLSARDPYTSALGSRKRTHDDVIKAPSVKLGRPAGPHKHCDVLREWCEKSSEDPTPWLKMTHASSVKPAVRHVFSPAMTRIKLTPRV